MKKMVVLVYGKKVSKKCIIKLIIKKLINGAKLILYIFFLQLPFKELAPLGTLSREVIQAYLTGQIGKTIKTIDQMLEVLLHNDCEPSKLKELQLQRNALIELMLSISQ